MGKMQRLNLAWSNMGSRICCKVYFSIVNAVHLLQQRAFVCIQHSAQQTASPHRSCSYITPKDCAGAVD